MAAEQLEHSEQDATDAAEQLLLQAAQKGFFDTKEDLQALGAQLNTVKS